VIARITHITQHHTLLHTSAYLSIRQHTSAYVIYIHTHTRIYLVSG
jgi:hypothetical protein